MTRGLPKGADDSVRRAHHKQAHDVQIYTNQCVLSVRAATTSSQPKPLACFSRPRFPTPLPTSPSPFHSHSRARFTIPPHYRFALARSLTGRVCFRAVVLRVHRTSDYFPEAIFATERKIGGRKMSPTLSDSRDETIVLRSAPECSGVASATVGGVQAL